MVAEAEVIHQSLDVQCRVAMEIDEIVDISAAAAAAAVAELGPEAAAVTVDVTVSELVGLDSSSFTIYFSFLALFLCFFQTIFYSL